MKKNFLIIFSILMFSTAVYAGNIVKVDSLKVTPTFREFFADVHLQHLVEQAVDSNLDLRNARLKIVEAQATLGNARNALLPKVTFDANGDIQRFGDSSLKTYKVGATPSWEVDISGRLRNSKYSAAASLESSYAYVLTVQTELVATLTKSYYTLLMLDEQKSISMRSLSNWQNTVETLKALRDAGYNNETAVLQARANIVGLQSSILTLDKSISDTESSICLMLNTPFHHILRDNLSVQSFPEDIATNGVPLIMVDQRPDVCQARLQLLATGYDTKVARAMFYPQLTLSGFLGWTNNGLEVSNPGKILMDALGALTMPLLNHGAIKSNLEIAKSRQEQAKLVFQKSILAAGKEVNDALTEWQTAKHQIEKSNLQISILKETVDKTKLLMENTSSTYLEVLTAEQSLLSAEMSLTQNQYSRIEAIITLYKAMGGGI